MSPFVRITLRGLAAAVLALVLAVPAGPAAGHAPDPVFSGGPYPQGLVLPYRWSPNATPPAAMRAAVLDAVAGSNGSRASKAPTFALNGTAASEVAYGGSVPCGTNGIACMRRDVGARWFGVWFRPHGHRFDWGRLRWCQMESPATDGCFDAENIALDELGHVLVLDHHDNFADDSDYLDAVVQTTSRTRPKAGWNAHVYGRCDVASLQRQYDVPSWTTRYSTCLDIPTELVLAAGSASVAYGAAATFTATLTTGDGYGRLSDNPVAGRVVVLQRRAGGTTWSDITTMAAAATAGTYAASVAVTSTGDWRAVYRRTSLEGLRGSTSGVVTVTVSGGCTLSPCPLRAPMPAAE